MVGNIRPVPSSSTFGAAKLRGSDALHPAFRTAADVHFLCGHAVGRPSARHAVFIAGAVGNCAEPQAEVTA